ncbi:MAG: hypothetical protein CM15mP103_02400 [Gammaproteobacteria bacterium]|nr:MAG: hypothetical protein CM15mP103_02400 [Gammaproteobacteria bacterium]
MRENAMMIDDTERREKQPFGKFIAGWPSDDVIGLWVYLKSTAVDWAVIRDPSHCAPSASIRFCLRRMLKASCAATAL